MEVPHISLELNLKMMDKMVQEKAITYMYIARKYSATISDIKTVKHKKSVVLF